MNPSCTRVKLDSTPAGTDAMPADDGGRRRLVSWAVMIRISILGILLAALSACPAGTSVNAPGRSAAQIPIKRVILYQNGVGYFERHGRVDGDVLTLQIRPSQINDLLKSLTVIDQSSGRAVSVSLPLEKTGAQVLSELPEQVRTAGGLLDVLRVFRGARVRVDAGTNSVSGRIVGVEPMEARARLTGTKTVVDWRLTLKTKGEQLRVLPVSDIRTITLDDRTLSFGLDQSLDVSLNEGNWKPIAFKVRLTGKNEHDLLASYIIEMPRWKPAYRLVVDDSGSPLLQGWAVVDNVSGEDWTQVELSLVAGTPMSFIYDLHSPQFPKRVDLTPRYRTNAPAPVIERVGRARNRGTKDMLQRRFSRSRRAGSLGDRSRDDSDGEETDMPEPEPEPDDVAVDGISAALGAELERQAPSSASGARVGSLFRYDIKDRVTIPDRSSTLVAIVNERVAGKEVVLFRPELTRSYVQSHPYRAVMFKNGTEFTLEKGPVTIYSRGTFVGEGFVERMERDTTSFLTYSIDGNVGMSSNRGTREEGLRLVKIVDGRVVSEVLRVERTTYQLTNSHAAPITAYVKTPKRSGWTLRNQPKDTVETAAAMFVPVALPATGEAELLIEWVKPVIKRMSIDTSLSTAVLKVYMDAGKAPPAVQKQLAEILEIKRKLGDIDSETARLDKQHRDLSADQDRVRRNIKLLVKTKGNQALRKELVGKLAKIEKTLGTLSGRLVRLSEQRAELYSKMTVLIRGISLTVEPSR